MSRKSRIEELTGFGVDVFPGSHKLVKNLWDRSVRGRLSKAEGRSQRNKERKAMRDTGSIKNFNQPSE